METYGSPFQRGIYTTTCGLLCFGAERGKEGRGFQLTEHSHHDTCASGGADYLAESQLKHPGESLGET